MNFRLKGQKRTSQEYISISSNTFYFGQRLLNVLTSSRSEKAWQRILKLRVFFYMQIYKSTNFDLKKLTHQ